MSTADAPLPVAPAVAGAAPHVIVVRAPYYRDVIETMTAGALAILRGAPATVATVDVAGAFELPQAIAIQCRHGAGADGFLALGCIVRGGTDHYDYICRATLDGLMRVAVDQAIALGAGVLTVHSIEQAEVRARHKGAEAAVAVLKQIGLRRASGGQGGTAPLDPPLGRAAPDPHS